MSIKEPNTTVHQQIHANITFLQTDLKEKHLDIYKIEGEHALGKPYVYEVSIVSAKRIKIEELADTEVEITLKDQKNHSIQRNIFGKIYAIKEASMVGDKHLYTLKVVHPLYYLGLNRRYEIYQELSAYEIIDRLLKRYRTLLKIDFHSNIDPRKFIKRAFTTQYGQSDLAFIQMLCEQEGVSLWMKEVTRPFVIRLAHINETYQGLTEALICSFEQSKTFAPSHSVEGYFDFRVPSKRYARSIGKTPLSKSLDENPHSAQLRHDLQLMRQHNKLEDPYDKAITEHASIGALMGYSNTELLTGKSHLLSTQVGNGGVLVDNKAGKEKEAIFTTVRMQGYFPAVLEQYAPELNAIEDYHFVCAFEASPKGTVFIPDYESVKPVIHSAVTAIVSASEKNPKANSIDIDAQGRIKVVFHFDPNFPTSCYIRFANFSAGDGWGSQFIPRVNTEVIVNFLDGNPDSPVAIGSLYNADNAMPQSLPENKSQSYIKTQSLSGNKSDYNLLLFEDKAGEEALRLKAHKDYGLHVGNDSTVRIDHSQAHSVGDNASLSVGKDLETEIAGDTKHTTHGTLSIKAGHKISNQSKVYEITGSDKVVFRSAGGTIELDQAGITLKGLVTIKGMLNVQGGMPDIVKPLSLSAQKGELICIPCLFKGATQ